LLEPLTKLVAAPLLCFPHRLLFSHFSNPDRLTY
jgi:hypothetical protein